MIEQVIRETSKDPVTQQECTLEDLVPVKGKISFFIIEWLRISSSTYFFIRGVLNILKLVWKVKPCNIG